MSTALTDEWLAYHAGPLVNDFYYMMDLPGKNAHLRVIKPYNRKPHYLLAVRYMAADRNEYIDTITEQQELIDAWERISGCHWKSPKSDPRKAPNAITDEWLEQCAGETSPASGLSFIDLTENSHLVIGKMTDIGRPVHLLGDDVVNTSKWLGFVATKEELIAMYDQHAPRPWIIGLNDRVLGVEETDKPTRIYMTRQ